MRTYLVALKSYFQIVLKRLKGTVEKTKQITASVSERERVYLAWHALTDETIRQYHNRDGVQIQFSTLAPTIETYIRILKETNVKLQIPAPITHGTFNEYLALDVNLETFMISEEKYYINVFNAIRQMRTEVLKLCELMVPSETEESGVFEHNKRSLSPLYKNLLIVAGSIKSNCQ